MGSPAGERGADRFRLTVYVAKRDSAAAAGFCSAAALAAFSIDSRRLRECLLRGHSLQARRQKKENQRHTMPTREEFDQSSALFEEAVALYEAAKAEFEAIEQLIQRTVRNGRAPSNEELIAEERARAKLYLARLRLTDRQRAR
jgi:hypothetical protein